MHDRLQDARFAFVSAADKAFIAAFDEEMTRRGYPSGGTIGKGFCWGRYMIIYAKAGVKQKKVAARIYLQDQGIVLRLFLTGLDKHHAYLHAAPPEIKEVFTGTYGDCGRCHNEKDGRCMFRKRYTLDERLIEKCNGSTFYFFQPTLAKLADYLSLFAEFYPEKKR